MSRADPASPPQDLTTPARPADSDPDPLWQHIPAPFQRRLGVLGLGLCVEASHSWLLDLAVDSLGRCAVPPADPDAIQLTLLGEDGDPSPASGADSAPGPRPGNGTPAPPPRLFHRERGPTYCAGDAGGSVVVADLAAGRALAFVGGATPAAIIRGVLIESPIWRIATWRGMVALHAAAVVIEGRTLVLRGEGGAGKSTLAYAAARAGHAVLAEEVTWFDPGQAAQAGAGRAPVGPGEAEACLRGLPWQLHLEDDAPDLFPETAARPPVARPDGQRKRLIAIGVDTPGPGVEQAPLGPLVFLQRDPLETRLVALDAEKARQRFMATRIPGEHAQPARSVERAVEALIARGAFVLRHAEPDAAVRLLADLGGLVRQEA